MLGKVNLLKTIRDLIMETTGLKLKRKFLKINFS